MKSKCTSVKSYSGNPLRFSPDWGSGHYEHTAAELMPAARELIELADPRPDEEVLDIGCGTGNGALLVAERGARVTGIDPAQRLLDVAAGEAVSRGLSCTFTRGEAAALPVAADSFDLAVSIFAVIFAPDARAAIDEITRVVRPDGRIVLSAWVPDGAISAAARATRQAVLAALDAPPPPPPFPWHEQPALADLFTPHGFGVALHPRTLAFRASSAEEFVDQDFDSHPMWIAARQILSEQQAQSARREAIRIYDAANESDDGFQVTSSYVIAVARRP